MRRGTVVILGSVLLIALAAIRAGGETQADEPQARASVVGEHRVYPKHYARVRDRFRPYSQPSPSQVRRIIRYEAQRWGVSAESLAARLWCESKFDWTAANGQYEGLGQFAYSTFMRGLSTMPHGVRVKVSRVVHRHTRIVREWSDGHADTLRGFRVKVRRTRIYVGRIPSSPGWLHGWAQVRIAAMALANVSAVHSSEWSCPA